MIYAQTGLKIILIVILRQKIPCRADSHKQGILLISEIIQLCSHRLSEQSGEHSRCQGSNQYAAAGYSRCSELRPVHDTADYASDYR